MVTHGPYVSHLLGPFQDQEYLERRIILLLRYTFIYFLCLSLLSFTILLSSHYSIPHYPNVLHLRSLSERLLHRSCRTVFTTLSSLLCLREVLSRTGIWDVFEFPVPLLVSRGRRLWKTQRPSSRYEISVVDYVSSTTYYLLWLLIVMSVKRYMVRYRNGTW